MKKAYEAPKLEFEVYELNQMIASNCTKVINSGPEHNGQQACRDWLDLLRPSTLSATYNVNFYEDTNCDCYYTSADGIFFTS